MNRAWSFGIVKYLAELLIGEKAGVNEHCGR